jgi:O-antigen ligase
MVAAVGLLNLVLAFRSLGATCLIAALYLLITHTMRKRVTGAQKLKKTVVLAITALVLLCGAGIYFGYQFAATSGLLGEEAQNKNESQSSGKYGVLLGGRTEMLGYLPAIYDSPILGHGSWAKDPKYFIAEREALAELGYSNAEDMSVEELEVGLIPTHSCLFGAWVDAGILGALFWAWMLVIIVKAFLRVYPASVSILPIMSLLGFQLLWDILFSPYGAKARYQVSYEFVMVITCAGMVPHAVVQSVLRKVKKRKAAALTPEPDQGTVPA